MALISHLGKTPDYFYSFYCVVITRNTLFSCMVCHGIVNLVPLTEPISYNSSGSRCHIQWLVLTETCWMFPPNVKRFLQSLINRTSVICSTRSKLPTQSWTFHSLIRNYSILVLFYKLSAISKYIYVVNGLNNITLIHLGL